MAALSGAGQGQGGCGAEAGDSDQPWDYAPGSHVWVSDEAQGWRPATVVATSSAGDVTVHLGDTGEDIVCYVAGGRARGQSRHAENRRLLPRGSVDGARGAANMDDMAHLHEASVLHNLKFRFAKDLIYTSVGPILIALNPYKALPIYTDQIIAGWVGVVPACVAGTLA